MNTRTIFTDQLAKLCDIDHQTLLVKCYELFVAQICKKISQNKMICEISYRDSLIIAASLSLPASRMAVIVDYWESNITQLDKDFYSVSKAIQRINKMNADYKTNPNVCKYALPLPEEQGQVDIKVTFK